MLLPNCLFRMGATAMILYNSPRRRSRCDRVDRRGGGGRGRGGTGRMVCLPWRPIILVILVAASSGRGGTGRMATSGMRGGARQKGWLHRAGLGCKAAGLGWGRASGRRGAVLRDGGGVAVLRGDGAGRRCGAGGGWVVRGG
ncbi:hypothetical protein ZWY2020_031093 [Hordeum vulgare]|nr:hypothetical protein ZWY2020_031093 [Hordeum vulgare]